MQSITFDKLLFYFFESFMLISAILVVTTNNAVYSIFFLILVFFNATFILLLLNAEFLALTLILVYIGSVAVLFLFVLIMLNIKLSELKEGMKQYILISFIFGLIFIFEALTIFNIKFVSLNLLETPQIKVQDSLLTFDFCFDFST